MQAITEDAMFHSVSTVASGAGQSQVLDSNWQVRAQTPAAGTQFAAVTPVSLAAGKLSKSSP